MRRAGAASLAGEHVVMVGASHKAAPVEVRERLHVGPRPARELAARLACGRRIRSETSLRDLPAPVPSATTRLAERLLGSLASAIALVVGAGEMSELVLCQHLFGKAEERT